MKAFCRVKGTVSFLVLVVVCIAVPLTSAAVAHVHEHKPGQKERTEDGAFSPRDAGHFGANGEHKSDFDHEAILGSAKAAREFDDLPPEEAKARLAKAIDANKDGGIDRKELNKWILRSLSLLSTEDSEDQFGDLDGDGDGKISWKEVLEDFAADGEDETSDEIKDDKEIFEAADLDKNGALDKNEFRHYSHPEESDKIRPILIKQSLSEKDQDGDGALNFQEFIGDASDKDKDWLLAEKEKFDSEHDKDKDGLLKDAEIADWLLPDSEDIAKEETDHLFAYADENHDNFLSIDEIVKHHEVFVGSEATDFGEHLSDDRLERLQDEL